MGKRTVEDTQAIHDVISGYGHAIDDRNWPAFGALLTDDVVIDYRIHDFDPPPGNGPYYGREAVLAAVSGELMDQHPNQHILVSHLIDDISDDEVLVRSKGLLPLGTDFRIASIGYRIGLRRTAEGWQIATLGLVMYPRPA